MASYQVAASGYSSQDNTLTASTVDTVMFLASALSVEVMADGTAAVYVTVDGSTPTVSGANTFKLPPVGSWTALVLSVPTEGAPVVKLISAGTPVYSVSIAS